MRIRQAEIKAIEASHQISDAFDRALATVGSALHILSGDDLSGEMSALPVEPGTDGRLHIWLDNVGLGTIEYHDENLLETRWKCPANLEFLVPHWHPCTERVQVVSGSCHFPQLGKVLLPGEVSIVPRNDKHVWKAGPAGCEMTVTWSPPLRVEVRT